MLWSEPGETVSVKLELLLANAPCAEKAMNIAAANATGAELRFGHGVEIPGNIMCANHGINTHKNKRSKHAGK